MEDRLHPDRIADAIEGIKEEIRFAELCQTFATAAGSKASSKSKRTFETCLVALKLAQKIHIQIDYYKSRYKSGCMTSSQLEALQVLTKLLEEVQDENQS